MLPQLRRLEETFPDDVVVIGVHAPKFPAERDRDNVRASVLAYGVEHPVVSDPDHVVWDAYAVSAWPTLVFVDPRGYVIGQQAGELRFPLLGEVVEQMLHGLRRAGILGYEGHLALRPEPRPAGSLAFPSAVLAAPDGRLVISDTGHHRIVVAAADGRIQRTFGRGTAGYSNGDGAAAFDNPRGLALDGDTLYVADTNNHAIRRIDLASGATSTLAGTGMQAERLTRGGLARETALSSPWDVELSPDRSTLYIAMAGFHQVWALDLASMMIGIYAGTGHEGIKDAERPRAWHAQPSGLSMGDGGILCVADSETSAVRAVDTAGPQGQVRTLAGEGLFVFGDADGPGARARLQHPLGVCATVGAVWVADSYNNKIKRIGITDGTVTTVAGNGEHGLSDGVGPEARLWEPGGLSALGSALYIADTNNHAIRVLDMESRLLTTVAVRRSLA